MTVASKMDSHSLRVLEYPAVLEILAAEAASILGRQRAALLLPSAEEDVVAHRLAETGEARELLRQGPLGGLERAMDIRTAVGRAEITGARLAPSELVAVADTLEAAHALRRILRETKVELRRLRRQADLLRPPVELVGEIRRCLGADGVVVDEATPVLARLRARAREAREAVRALLQELLLTPRLQPIIAEPIITLRNDRYVIPVTPAYRTLLAGVVQDQSGSGHTLFLEPLAAVELNNTIRRLEREAETEADRVLGELTAGVGAAAEPIRSTVEALADLDLAFAKARLADRWGGAAPAIAPEGEFALLAVRHPLLLEARRGSRAAVVPIDVVLPPDVRVLVITGPNTGGKSVALKTIGLAALLAQAGLHIPAGGDSRLPLFRTVYADIGDEQSIAQDLSTFSAHLRRLELILGEAGPRDLVLIDEMGAGTDPGEGAALGSAVLEALAGRGCHCLATTHLDGIKAFVAEDRRMLNAAVDFDLDRLSPTYRLHIGLPGRSFAIEIACRLGIPPSILHRARELAGDASAGISALLERLRSLEAERETEAEKAAQERKAAEAERAEAEELAAELRKQVRAVRTRAGRLVEEIAAETRRRAEAIVAELKRGGAAGTARPAIRHLGEAAETGLAELPEVAAELEGPGLTAVEAGQRVRVGHLGQVGTVLSSAQGLAEVQLPVGKIRVPLAQLHPAAPGPARSAGGGVSWTAGAGDALAPEIKVIGCTVEEATARVQRYLEDAALGGLQRVRIIHGKGTGRLRQGVAALLKEHPLVSGFQMAGFDEGGAGATIVELGAREAGAPAPDPGQQQGTV